MSSILAVISESKLLGVFFAWMSILLIGGIISMVVRIAGNYKLSKRIDFGVRIYGALSTLIFIVGSIVFFFYTMYSM